MQVFIQAGVVDGGFPVWNTSSWISERSITGQLLHAIFSYEASPTRIEIIAWLIVTNLDISVDDARILLLYGALPTAMSSYVLASQLGGDKAAMARIITLQTLFASLTLPVVLLAMHNL